ncbi:antibiotic resistance protein VanZ [Halobacteriales archaeon QS_8_69_73]|nr:MAG: antibiotic resistance protein VanZ [Halobacteriales archaeon QS_8_69_73]
MDTFARSESPIAAEILSTSEQPPAPVSRARSDAASTARWVTIAACATVIVASVVRPPAALDADIAGVGLDKWAHVAGTAVLAVAVAAARRVEGRDLLVIAAAVVALGAAIEGIQVPLAHRTASLADAAANGVGAVLGVAGWRLAATNER